MRTLSVMGGRFVAGVILQTCVTGSQFGSVAGMLKLIVFAMFAPGGLALELRISWRSEPVPVSLVLVTVNVIAGAALGLLNLSKLEEFLSRSKFQISEGKYPLPKSF